MRVPVRRATLRGSAAALIAAVACVDHESAAPSLKGVLHLSLSASVAGSAAGRVVAVRVFYVRPPSEQVALLDQSFDVDLGTKELPVAVDIAPCLTDASREGGARQRCLVHLSVVLRDATGAPVDSQAIGPIDASPGTTVDVPPLTLSEATTITVVSGGDQIGFAGQNLLLPVDVKVAARGGVALADRPVVVVPALGGGTVVTQQGRTGPDGVARITYRAGTAAGVNTFRVTAPGLAGAEVTVSARGILPARSSIAAGSLFTCLLESNRRIRCAGDNTYGTLGNPDVGGVSFLFVPIASTRDFVSVVAANQNNITSRAACALTPDGDVYCWGTNEGGTLGVNSTDVCPSFGGSVAPRCAKTPTLVSGAPKFVTITVAGGAGQFNARGCGITIAGEAYCWGQGALGELGNGANVSTSAPVRVAGPEKFVQISTGEASTCGVAATGALYCWGANSSGQLGNGSTTPSNIPVRVVTPLTFLSVSVGSQTVCAVSTTRRVHCWGASLVGGLPLLQPGPSAGEIDVSGVSMGIAHVCGVTSAGLALCAGNGSNGVLGNGTRRPSPGPSQVLGGQQFVEVSAGGIHSCGLSVQSDVYCWGNNGSGEFGTGYQGGIGYVPVRANLANRSPGSPAQLQPVSVTQYGPLTVGSRVGLIQYGEEPSVRVVDASGIGVSGVTVNLAVTAGGGSVTSSSVVSGVGGFALIPWRGGPTPGVNSLTASISGVAGSVVFTAPTAIPGPAAFLTLASCCFPRAAPAGSRLTGALPVVVTLDATLLAVPNVPITFTLLKPGSQISPPSPALRLTDADGIAGVDSWTLDGVPRADTLAATAPGLPPFYFVVTTLSSPNVTGALTFRPSTVSRVNPTVSAPGSTPPATTFIPIDRSRQASTFDHAIVRRD